MTQDWNSNYQWDSNQTWNDSGQPATPTVQQVEEEIFQTPPTKKGGWDKWTTIPTVNHAFAFLGNNQVSHTFRFNPDTAQWGYQENITSMDTIGGRVVQLLSVNITDITINGRAGNRGELQRMADNIKSIMNYQTNTMNPVLFKVPSRNWEFAVYIKSMPQLGWDLASTSYPYQLILAVDQELRGVKTKQIANTVISNLAKQIGYRDDIHGGNAQKFYSIIETVSQPLTGDSGGGSTSPGDTSDCSQGEGKIVTGYDDCKKVEIRICNVSAGGNHVIGIHTSVAQKCYDLLKAADADGVSLQGSAYRTIESQIDLYNQHRCNPPWNGNPCANVNVNGCSVATAWPGTSRHNMGLAIDFAVYNFNWLKSNARRFGFQQCTCGEAWHWSTDGG